jgi:hypothetical protein
MDHRAGAESWRATVGVRRTRGFQTATGTAARPQGGRCLRSVPGPPGYTPARLPFLQDHGEQGAEL